MKNTICQSCRWKYKSTKRICPMCKTPKRKTLKQLKKALWTLVSKYVRKSNADDNGYVACIVCGKKYLWNSGLMDAGHWIHDKLDYYLPNIHPECRNCNYKYNKNSNAGYAVYMSKTYGSKEMEGIIKYAQEKGNLYTYDEVVQLTTEFEDKLSNLEGK